MSWTNERTRFTIPTDITLLLSSDYFFSRRKNNRATAENALARLRDLLELKEFNQDADEVFFFKPVKLYFYIILF